MAIAGFDRESYRELAPYVTALPMGTKLNVNTASDVVLASLSDDLDLGRLSRLVEERADAEFIDIDATFEGLVEPDTLRRDRWRQRAFFIDRNGDARVKSAHDALRAAARSERHHAVVVPQPRSRVAWPKRSSFVCPTPGLQPGARSTPRGVSSAALGRGALQSAQQALGARRCVSLVDAVDVLTADAALPAASHARLRQIVPFSLEESLADDVDQMVFAIGATAAAGDDPDRGRRQSTLWTHGSASCAPAGIVPNAVVLRGRRRSGHPGDARAHHRRRTHRRPQARAAAVRVRGARVSGKCCDSCWRAKPRSPSCTTSACSRTRQAARRFDAELAALGGQFASADVKILNDGVFPHLAATLAQRAGTNLLQGPYAPKSNWLAMVRPWRLAASLAAASIVLALLLQGAEYWQLRRADVALGDVVATDLPARRRRIEHVGLPARGVAAARCQCRLGDREFLEHARRRSLRFATAEMRIDALSYRNRVMDLQLVAPSVPALDEFSRALEETRRFDVEIEASQPASTPAPRDACASSEANP